MVLKINRIQSNVVYSVKWQEIETAIWSLDNDKNTSIRFDYYKDNELVGYLLVEGGNSNIVRVNYLDLENERIFYLLDPTNTKSVELVVGGQKAEYPVEGNVNKEMALKAAKEFYDSQTLSTELTWDSDVLVI